MYKSTNHTKHAFVFLDGSATSEEADDDEERSGSDDRVNTVGHSAVIGDQFLEGCGSLQRPDAKS